MLAGAAGHFSAVRGFEGSVRLLSSVCRACSLFLKVFMLDCGYKVDRRPLSREKKRLGVVLYFLRRAQAAAQRISVHFWCVDLLHNKWNANMWS